MVDSENLGLIVIAIFFLHLLFHVAISRKLTVLYREAGKAGSFLAKLTLSEQGVNHKVAGAHEFYLDTTGKKNSYRFRQIFLASGAKWSCNSDGEWHLFESNGTKVEASVLEFLECFGFPGRFAIDDPEEARIYVKRLASLLKLGLGLPVEYLQRAAYAKQKNTSEDAVLLAKDNNGKAPSC